MGFSEDCTTGTCVLADDDSSLTGGSFNGGTGITQQHNSTGNVTGVTRTVTPTSGNNKTILSAFAAMGRNAGYTNTVQIRDVPLTVLASHAIAGAARISAVGVMHVESNVAAGTDFNSNATGGTAIQCSLLFQVVQI